MENEEKVKVTGVLVNESYFFRPEQKEGAGIKKCWCSLKIKTGDKMVTVKLYDQVAVRFNEMQKLEGMKLSFEGKMRGKEYKGGLQLELTGYSFHNEMRNIKEDKKEENKEESFNLIRLVEEVSVRKEGSERVEPTREASFSDYTIVEDDPKEVSKYGLENKDNMSRLIPKNLELHEMTDDMGKFGEALVNVFGNLSLLIGRWVSIKMQLEGGGSKPTYEELKIIAASDKGIVGTNKNGNEIKILLSDTIMLDQRKAGQIEDNWQKRRYILDEHGGLTTNKIVDIEIKQEEKGQRFYSNRIFYTPENGFLGLTKDQLKDHLSDLLRGKKVYRQWVKVMKGEKIEYEGSVQLYNDPTTGTMKAQGIAKSEEGLKSGKLDLNISRDGQTLPVLIDEKIWKVVEESEKGRLIAFGKVMRNDKGEVACLCVNKNGDELLLKGQAGIGYLSIDSKLNKLLYVPVAKEQLRKQLQLGSSVKDV